MAIREYAGLGYADFLDGVWRGIDQNMGEKETVIINGKPVGKPALLAQIEAKLQPYKNVEAARTEVTRLVNVRDATEDDVGTFIAAVDAGITATFGTDPHVKAKYGIPPTKVRRELTVVEKLQMLAKRKETRIRRHTMGKRQKEKIKAKGDVTVNTTFTDSSAGAGNGAQANGGAGSASMNGGPNPPAGGPVGNGGASSGGTNVMAGGPAASGGGAPSGGTNVAAGSAPASGGTNVVVGGPAPSGAPGGAPASGGANAVNPAVAGGQNGAQR